MTFIIFIIYYITIARVPGDGIYTHTEANGDI